MWGIFREWYGVFVPGLIQIVDIVGEGHVPKCEPEEAELVVPIRLVGHLW